MTPEAQRLAIAEACGWYQPNHREGFVWDNSKQEVDPLNDLNAIQSAVLTLTPIQIALFQQELGIIATHHLICFCECSPLMWCEAFLKTLNLWKQ